MGADMQDPQVVEAAQSFAEMLADCALKEDVAGNQSLQDVEDAIGALESAVFRSLRRVDVSARYSARQFVVVLMDTDEEHGRIVVERILAKYRCIYDGQLDFSYDIVKM